MFTLQVHTCGHRFYFLMKTTFTSKNNAIQILIYLGSGKPNIVFVVNMLDIPQSAMPEVRGTADRDGGAYSPSGQSSSY